MCTRMTEAVEWLAVQVPGGRLWGQLMRSTKLVGRAWCLRALEGQPDLPLQRALVVLLPVLPGATGGPEARDFSALWDRRTAPQDTD